MANGQVCKIVGKITAAQVWGVNTHTRIRTPTETASGACESKRLSKFAGQHYMARGEAPATCSCCLRFGVIHFISISISGMLHIDVIFHLGPHPPHTHTHVHTSTYTLTCGMGGVRVGVGECECVKANVFLLSLSPRRPSITLQKQQSDLWSDVSIFLCLCDARIEGFECGNSFEFGATLEACIYHLHFDFDFDFDFGYDLVWCTIRN